MKHQKIYSTNVETRFNFHLSLWSGIIAFFTNRSPYKSAIDNIREMDISKALQSDAQQLRSDFQNGCKKNNVALKNQQSTITLMYHKTSQEKTLPKDENGTQKITGQLYHDIMLLLEMIKGYGELDSPMPKRIIRLLEEEAIHRRRIEIKILKNDFQTITLSTILAFLSLISLGVLSYFFMINGHGTQGAWIAGTIGTVIGIFLYRKASAAKKE